MKKIILASASPRRRDLLKSTGLNFRIIPAGINETAYKNFPPGKLAILLAREKAAAVAAAIPSGIVIGADTLVAYKGRIFGKPKGLVDAKRMLQTLSNSRHEVYTGLAVINVQTGFTLIDLEKTTLITRKLSPAQIKKLAKKNHDKAGAYAVQKDADILVKKIEGDYYNVVGLPLKKLGAMLKHFPLDLKNAKFS